MNRRDELGWRDGSIQFWILVIFLALVFVFGGSARSDVQGLMVLRPLSLMAVGISLALISYPVIKRDALLLGMGLAPLLIAGFYIVPLPPVVGQLLPGHQLLSRIDDLAPLADAWRPLSLYPSATLNAFHSLFIPTATLLVTVQLSKKELQLLFKFVLFFTILTALIGVLQVVGDPRGPLYFYDMTNHGNVVGLFANRNHQAIMLAMLFPMLAYFASTQDGFYGRFRWPKYLFFGASIIIITLILVTGSRIGFMAAVAALLASMAFFLPSVGRRTTKARHFPLPIVPTIIVIFVALVAVAMQMSRATAFVRLFAPDEGAGARAVAWRIGMDSFGNHPIFGSGPGTFAQSFLINEPVAFLRFSYLNQMHNDWLDIALTTGSIGIFLALAAIVVILKMTWSVTWAGDRSRKIALGRLGATIIMLLVLGSITDYPLRTPIMMCILVIAFVWLTRGNENSIDERTGSPSRLGLPPNKIT